MGAHYHYKVVIGASGNTPLSRIINRKVTGDFGPRFFATWQRHNVHEVGTFENFLPALFAQKADLSSLEYARDMNPARPSPATQQGHDKARFESQLDRYRASDRPHKDQQYENASFL